jgi:hypothetical protein
LLCRARSKIFIRVVGIDDYEILTPNVIHGNKIRVVAYVREGLKATSIAQVSPNVIGLRIPSSGRSPELKMFGFYRTHQKITESLSNDLKLALEGMTFSDPHSVTLIAGDFNLDFGRFHDVDYHNRGLVSQVQNWMAENGFVQLISEITWRRVVKIDETYTMRCSTLDHIYVNREDVVVAGILESMGSDHEMIGCELKWKANDVQPVQKFVLRDWRGFVPKEIRKFTEKNVLSIDGDLHVNDSIAEMNAYVQMMIEELAPERVLRTRRPKDIVNVKIEAIKKRRDRLLKQHRAAPENQEILSKLKIADRQVRLFIKQEKSRQRTLLAETSDPRLFWKTIREAENTTTAQNSTGKRRL